MPPFVVYLFSLDWSLLSWRKQRTPVRLQKLTKFKSLLGNWQPQRLRKSQNLQGLSTFTAAFSTSCHADNAMVCKSCIWEPFKHFPPLAACIIISGITETRSWMSGFWVRFSSSHLSAVSLVDALQQWKPALNPWETTKGYIDTTLFGESPGLSLKGDCSCLPACYLGFFLCCCCCYCCC